jgi:hypothetical protein
MVNLNGDKSEKIIIHATPKAWAIGLVICIMAEEGE